MVSDSIVVNEVVSVWRLNVSTYNVLSVPGVGLIKVFDDTTAKKLKHPLPRTVDESNMTTVEVWLPFIVWVPLWKSQSASNVKPTVNILSPTITISLLFGDIVLVENVISPLDEVNDNIASDSISMFPLLE